ncbi:hypothetical protein [Lachnobacterium bovis]|uniref:hypothetical protein n=1 Tax=Lachnobacterium bovis TaxID=140626 RepID=UPI0004887882|nr:hypothetical protein [Lachnobacterium bovis]
MKRKLKLSANAKVYLVVIVLMLLFGVKYLNDHQEYTRRLLFMKDKIIYSKTDEKNSFKPNLNKLDLIERSTTPDDSVCIVSDITNDQKKKLDDYQKCSVVTDNWLSYREWFDMSFFDYIQRRSSNKFTQISFTYNKPLFFAKKDGYRKKKIVYELEDYGDNFASKLTSIKLQTYDIDKKKIVNDKELISNYLLDNIEELLSYICPKKLRLTRLDEKGQASALLVRTGEHESIDFKLKYECIEKNRIFNNVEVRSGENFYVDFGPRKNWMDSFDFLKLLKKNGINTKGVFYMQNHDDYNDVNFIIRTESLPKKDAYLYKVYPGLKKYIGKKGKWARFYLKGVKSSDELASYFLPEGQKISYGDGIEFFKEISVKEDCIKKVIKAKSLEEYYNNLPEEELEVMENHIEDRMGLGYISCS